ncbi:MAG: hypothetical protein IKQ60_03885 [Candidatus Methanomethylophilaceae archaeon]|nr:hypothetical protein [Candidatus Methanomethylophilaceae archaeon]
MDQTPLGDRKKPVAERPGEDKRGPSARLFESDADAVLERMKELGFSQVDMDCIEMILRSEVVDGWDPEGIASNLPGWISKRGVTEEHTAMLVERLKEEGFLPERPPKKWCPFRVSDHS